MDKELDKMIDAEIEEAIISEHQYNFEEEMENFHADFCCTECQQQAAYFL